MKRILSTALALCLFCMAAAPTAYACQDSSPHQKASRIGKIADASVPADTTGNPTEKQVYDHMIAMKKDYPEGSEWSGETPYSLSNPYLWAAGSGIGANKGSGCAGFAFMLSDAGFGTSLPAGVCLNFQYSDVHVGDILRLNYGAHTVIVLQVNPYGVVSAEGNYNKTVHWGRTLTKAEVESAGTMLITRYVGGKPLPDGSSPNDPLDLNAAGTLGNGLSWKLAKSGTLTISGTGAMLDYTTKEEQPWWNYRNNILNISIGDSVTRVGKNAFCESAVIGVTIPESVTEIGEKAFYGCKNLKSVALPASVTKVGTGAFWDDKDLKYVIFAPSDKTVELGDGIFMGCWHLVSVSLPRNTAGIGANMFSSCSSLSSLYVPKSVTQLGQGAFTNCNALTNIYYDDSKAKWDALLTADMYLNQMLQSLPKPVTIHYNESLPSPYPTTGDPIINDGAQYSVTVQTEGGGTASASPGSSAAMEKVTLTAYAGSGYHFKEWQVVSGGVTISSSSFAMPAENVTVKAVFEKDSSGAYNPPSYRPPVVTPTQSATPTEPTEPAQPENPTQPTEPAQPAEPAPPAVKPGQTVTDKKTGGSYEITEVKGRSTVAYDKPANRNKTSVLIPAAVEINGKTYKVTEIAGSAFKGNTKVRAVQLGANVQTIGASAFRGCTGLTKISLPGKVKTIEKSAFYGCKNLKAITIKTTGLTAKTIGKDAFKGLPANAVIKVPKAKVKAYKKLFQARGLSKKATIKVL